MSLLIALVSGFASGVATRSLWGVGWPVVGFALLLGVLSAGAACFVPRRAYTLGAVFFVLFAIGVGRTALFESPLPPAFKAELRHRAYYTGTVVGEPSVKDASQRVPVEITKGSETTTMLVVAPRTEQVMVGDTVSVSGTLLLPEPFADEGGRVFRYDKYLEKSGVRFILDYGSIHIVRAAPWYSLPAALARVKHVFEGGLARALPEPIASLAAGIVIGGKSGLGDELQAAFVATGLVQIIVLSGYNVMIVAEWVLAGLAQMSLSRRWSALAASVALLVFVGIAGFSATALRAALMALIALYARATGKSYTASRALLVVVLLMLAWNPYYLAFDPSFDLSVVATAGLIWLAPLLEERLVWIRSALWKTAVATTLAAQIAVLPLLLYETGNLSLVAVPANLLVMPIVPLAMALSAIAGIVGALMGGVAPLAAIIIGLPAYALNEYIVLVARGAAALPFAAFTLPAFSFALVLAAYAGLIAIAASKRASTTRQLRFLKKASR